ncbi:hypothetical protein ACF073_06350 [Streptomyces sp. NPDC015171]|uniref:hypothetical protein n=1 Tax=Streptomyces sp. NPDC015171 TaxID=3364945 RepID=UPI0036FACBA4
MPDHPEGGEPAIARGSAPYTCGDAPGSAPQVPGRPPGRPDGDADRRLPGPGADRPRDTEDTLAALARGAGCGNAFALSSAFGRVYGVGPREHRTRAA